jgi:nitrogen fixation protein
LVADALADDTVNDTVNDTVMFEMLKSRRYMCGTEGDIKNRLTDTPKTPYSREGYEKMGLLKPAWESDNREEAVKAVEKEKDQSKLCEIAKNAADYNVRLAAVERLTDQAVIAYVAKNDTRCEVRYRVVERLTDQAVLAYVAKNDTDDKVRSAAVKRLAEQTLAQKAQR